MGGNDGLEIPAAASHGTERRVLYGTRHRRIWRAAVESAAAKRRQLLRFGNGTEIGEYRRHWGMDAMQVSRELSQRIQRRCGVGRAQLQRSSQRRSERFVFAFGSRAKSDAVCQLHFQAAFGCAFLGGIPAAENL